MITDAPTLSWTVDLAQGRATCGSTVISFARRPGHAFDIAFLAVADCSLEEQCLIAGEAAEAIKARIGAR